MEANYSRREVGQRIRKLRNYYGITREQMARTIGRTPKHYSDVERGSVGMSLETLIGIADCFHVSIDYLLLGREKSSEEELLAKAEEQKMIEMIRHLPPEKRIYVRQSMELFAKAWNVELEEEKW